MLTFSCGHTLVLLPKSGSRSGAALLIKQIIASYPPSLYTASTLETALYKASAPIFAHGELSIAVPPPSGKCRMKQKKERLKVKKFLV
jgi:hypothetical protein